MITYQICSQAVHSRLLAEGADVVEHMLSDLLVEEEQDIPVVT